MSSILPFIAILCGMYLFWIFFIKNSGDVNNKNKKVVAVITCFVTAFAANNIANIYISFALVTVSVIFTIKSKLDLSR